MIFSPLFQNLSSSMVYQIRISSSHLTSNNAQFVVNRYFTDFVSMYAKLVTKYLPEGIIIPALPENDSGIAPKDAVERRRAQLERYLNRLARHETLMSDTNFLMFIQSPEKLSDVTNNHWRSLLLCTSITKTGKDDWFDRKQVNIVILTFLNYRKARRNSNSLSTVSTEKRRNGSIFFMFLV